MLNNNNRTGTVFYSTGGNSIFSTNAQQPQSNIFGGNQQQQQGPNIFGGNQQQQQGFNHIFGNQQQQQGTNNFGNQGNQQRTNNLFGGNQQQQAGNVFGGNQQQQAGNVFGGNQQQQAANVFGGNQQQPNVNIFGGNQQQQSNSIFTNQQQQPQQGANIFSNQQQQQAQNIFANNQQQQGGNIFGNQQQQQGGNIFGNQLQQQQLPLNQMIWQSNQNSTEDVRLRIKALCDRIDPKNLEQIKLDEMNMFKDQRLGDLTPEFKQSLKILMNNMLELRKLIDNIKRENENLNKQAEDYCAKVQAKLITYKEVLIQNIQQSNLIEDVRKEVEMIQKQTIGVIIPLYNAYSRGAHQTFDSPDDFSANIARNVLEKMVELNNKVDEIVSCHQERGDSELSEQQANTIVVLEQLVMYYENVSAKVFEFSQKYNAIKRIQIQKNQRTASYEEVMRRIQDKVKTKMDKDFKCYDLIKEIEDILAKREKREDEFKEKYLDRSRQLRYNDDYTQGWGRYGRIY